MNKNEFIGFAANLGKLLGAKPTMDNYTFSDPKSPVFQIKENELRSVVRKAKALKDLEAHGIDDIEWDFEEGYICFMLPGGFALYLSTEADMEMNEAEAAKALNTRAANKMNESSKSELLKLAQTAAKSLGIKFKETPSSYKALMGASFEITEKDFIKIVNAFKRSQSDPAAFGFYEMTFDNPEMSVLIDFEDEEDSILFYVGGMSEANESNAANEATNTLNEASEERMRKKARAIAKFFGVEIDDANGHFGFFASSAGIDKSSYDKVIKIINQTKNIEKKLGVNFVEVWSKVNSIRFNVYRSEDDIFFKLQSMNESYDHIPEYTPSVSNEMNESTEAVELNEVTGLPKHKTSVPSHLL